VDSKAIEMEGLLGRLTTALAKAEADADTARRERAEAEAARQELADRLDALKRDRKATLRKAVEEARGLVDNTRREMQRALDEARRAGGDAAATRHLRRQVEQKRDVFRKRAEQLTPRPRAALPLDRLAVGQVVWVESMNRHGTVSGIDRRRGKVTLDAGGLAIEVEASAIREPDAGAGPSAPPAPAEGRTVVNRPASVAPEINLIGQRVEEALRHLETYLNQACLAGLASVRVIHGHGTGALRTAIHTALRRHPLIESVRFGEPHEGGRGATVATLK